MERTIFLAVTIELVENCLNTFKTLRKNHCNIDVTLSREFLSSRSRSWYWTKKNSTYLFYKININQIYDAYVTQHKKANPKKKLGQLIFERFSNFTKIDEAYLLRSRKVFWEKKI